MHYSVSNQRPWLEKELQRIRGKSKVLEKKPVRPWAIARPGIQHAETYKYKNRNVDDQQLGHSILIVPESRLNFV
jgi:hypothetical protein